MPTLRQYGETCTAAAFCWHAVNVSCRRMSPFGKEALNVRFWTGSSIDGPRTGVCVRVCVRKRPRVINAPRPGECKTTLGHLRSHAPVLGSSMPLDLVHVEWCVKRVFAKMTFVVQLCAVEPRLCHSPISQQTSTLSTFHCFPSFFFFKNLSQ